MRGAHSFTIGRGKLNIQAVNLISSVRNKTFSIVPDPIPTPSGTFLVNSVAGESVRAFIPNPLPPALNFDLEDFDLMERANRALGRLDGILTLLPDPDLFLYFYVRKEAILSSQIEGTQSSLAELLLYENDESPGVPTADVVEVSNYVSALDYGLTRLREFPLSLRLIKEIHGVLLNVGRGSDKSPGEFRRSQVWIGGQRPGLATFVPPPPDKLQECLNAFEHFLHKPNTPALIKAALAHVQFETIHPFLDGNGRMGRLLITFLLCAEGVLAKPLLYLSLFFKTHREEYYERLQRVRTHGEWEDWLRFFLRGVEVTSAQAVETAKEILALFDRDRNRIKETMGTRANSTLRVHEVLQQRPRITVKEAQKRGGVSYPTAKKSLEHMVRLGITREVTGGNYRMSYLYESYMSILERGTEPL